MCEGVLLPVGTFLSNLSAGDKVDAVCAVIALISIGLGAHRGLSAELPLGVGWFCGVLSAWYAYPFMHTFFQELSFMEDQPELLFTLSAVTLVLLTWGVAVLVGNGLRRLAVRVEKKPADYVFGTVVGVVRAFFILLIITFIMLSETWWKGAQDLYCTRSRTGKLFTPWVVGLEGTLQKLCPSFQIHRRMDDPGDLGSQPPKRP